MLNANSEYSYFPNSKADSTFPYLVLNVNHGEMVPKCARFKIMHYHEDLQLIYVLAGHIEICSLNTIVYLNAGMGLYINRNAIHRIIAHDGCHYYSFIFPESFLKFYFASPAVPFIEKLTHNEEIEFIQLINSEVKSDEVSDAAQNSKKIYSKQLVTLLSKLVSLEESKSSLYEYEVLVTLSEIALLMLKDLDKKAELSKSALDLTLNTRMQRFLDFIALHFKEEITLEALAQAAFVSKSECLRCFKKALQTTPYKYLNEFRLMKAGELLKNSTLSIAAVAEAVGFRQQSHFGACFKEKMGITPRQYRVQAQKQSG